MAIIGGTDEEDKNQAAGAGGGSYAGSEGGGGATTKAAPTSSGNYTNLVNYLGANQGSGAATANAVGATVDQSATDANAANDKYGSSGAKQIGGSWDPVNTVGADAATVAPGKDVSSPGSGGAGHSDGLSSPMPTVPDAPAPATAGGWKPTDYQNSNAYASDPNVLSGMLSGSAAKPAAVSYGGPDSAASLTGQAGLDYTAAAQTQNTAQGMSDQTKKGLPGISSLLSSTYKQPGYTQGENGLDSFLVGSGANQGTVTDAGKRADQAAGGYDRITAALNGQIAKNNSDVAGTNAIYAAAPTAADSIGETSDSASAPIAQANLTAKAPTQKTALAPKPVTPDAPNKPSVQQDIKNSTAKEGPNPGANVGLPTLDQIAKKSPVPLPTLQNPLPTINKYKVPHLAEGGEIPSYSKLLQMLKR